MGSEGLGAFSWGLLKAFIKCIIILMAEEKESNYCDKCRRLKIVSCTCDMTFAEKVKTTQVNWYTWSDTRKGR